MANMERAPSVVVLDESNELSRIEVLVNRIGVDCVRWKGEEAGEPPKPRDLLVTTGANALKLTEAEAHIADEDGPVWLCVHNEDFFPLRDRLRERGVHYLVQMTTDDEALRLLLQQVLYRGTDRREKRRLPMDCQVEVKLDDGGKSRAKLLELSSEGCRFEHEKVLENGTALTLKIPDSLGGRKLEIPGRIIRSESQRSGKDILVMQLGDLEPEVREQLDAIIRGDRIGTRVTPLADVPEREPEAYVDGTGIPDWESLATTADRRRHPRRPFAQPVETVGAEGAGDSHSVMGVELSVEGMRVVGLPDMEVGSEVRVALHSNEGAEPFALEAKVLRDDGESVVLQFCSMGSEVRAQIEALMDEKPVVEDLQTGNAERIVMSEITEMEFSLAG
jgi:hypothetical protein